jgi:hypothetical protein
MARIIRLDSQLSRPEDSGRQASCMHLLTTLLTVATLLTHSIVGCCWHAHAACVHGRGCEASVTHPHAEHELAGECSASGTLTHEHGTLGLHTHVACDEEHPTPRRDRSDCEHSECAFVLARGVTLDLSWSGATIIPVSAEHAVVVVAQPAAARAAERSQANPAESAGRVRALLQVWVV